MNQEKRFLIGIEYYLEFEINLTYYQYCCQSIEPRNIEFNFLLYHYTFETQKIVQHKIVIRLTEMYHVKSLVYHLPQKMMY